MKSRNIFLAALAFTFVYFIGCSSTTRPVPYSFTEDENTNETATIIFVSKSNDIVRLVDFEGKEAPLPKYGTHWEPVTLPAGRPLKLRVYVGWKTDKHREDMPGYRRRGIFNCPALEAGKEYKLWFDTDRDDKNKKANYYGTGYLVLTDVNVNKLSYFFKNRNSPMYKQIYVQEVRGWPQL
jgi:hypothetical protein